MTVSMGSSAPRTEASGKLRLLTCHGCETTELVYWCGQAVNCQDEACMEALEAAAARHRSDPPKFHAPVSLIEIPEGLYHAEEAS